MTAKIIQFGKPRHKPTAPPRQLWSCDPAEWHERTKRRKRDGEMWERWRNVEGRTKILEAYHEYVRACRNAERYGMTPREDFDVDDDNNWLAAWRLAVAQQLLTPAPTKEALEWKIRQKLTCLPVSREQVARSIAADEAYLAQYRRRKAQ